MILIIQISQQCVINGLESSGDFGVMGRFVGNLIATEQVKGAFGVRQNIRNVSRVVN
jgi:hypothetical protein